MIDINEYMNLSLDERKKHLRLDEDCIERGGPKSQTLSSYCKALMAHVLDTSIPTNRNIYVCHACHNSKCSNPYHLYWGTPKENWKDSFDKGTVKTTWQNMIEKHGYEKALAICKNNRYRETSKHTIYYTNGIKEIRLKPNQEIPEGFYKGRNTR